MHRDDDMIKEGIGVHACQKLFIVSQRLPVAPLLG
jgi:hypothetical protein